jgi:hypothetical protein
MPLSDSIKAEMQKVNAVFGEAVVKGRNFAALDQVYTLDARRRAPTSSKAARTSRVSGRWLLRA